MSAFPAPVAVARAKRTRALLLALIVGGTAATGACASDDEPSASAPAAGEEHVHDEEPHDEEAAPAFTKADATTAVDVTLRDYAFVGLPPTVKGPNVFFDATVAGGNTHELEIVDGGGTPVDEIPAFKQGKTRSLAVALEPGTYTVQCLVKEGTRTHAQLGMKQTLTVE